MKRNPPSHVTEDNIVAFMTCWLVESMQAPRHRAVRGQKSESSQPLRTKFTGKGCRDRFVGAINRPVLAPPSARASIDSTPALPSRDRRAMVVFAGARALAPRNTSHLANTYVSVLCYRGMIRLHHPPNVASCYHMAILGYSSCVSCPAQVRKGNRERRTKAWSACRRLS